MKGLEEILEQFMRDIIIITKLHDLLLLKHKYLGENSDIYTVRHTIRDLPLEERKIIAPKIHKIIQTIEQAILEKKEQILTQGKSDEDFTKPVYQIVGKKHILNEEIACMKSILLSLGFEYFEAPEIDSVYHNFTALNVPTSHPCIDREQTFYINQDTVLRTQTSNGQNYLLKEKGASDIKSFSIGRVYRRDSDSTHLPMFHQLEVVKCGKNSTMVDLFQTLKTFISMYFNKSVEIRVRSSFFPFTAPSFEIDVLLNNKWLEILGSGMIHSQVLKHGNSPHKIGFAFGCGVERFIMLKHNILNMKNIYSVSSNLEVVQC